MNKGFLLGLMLVLLVGLATAIPGIPHRFFGSVTINGAPAPNGATVTATVDGVTAGKETTSSGAYGYDPIIFFVEDPNNNRDGKTIKFYVNGYDTGQTTTFVVGGSTELDLSVTYTVSNPPSGGSGGSDGGGGGLPPEDLWDCGEWSECVDDEQTQDCTQGYATKTNTRDCEVKKTEKVTTTTPTTSDVEEGEGVKEELVTGPGSPPEAEEVEDLGPTGAVVGGAGLSTPAIFLIVLVALIAVLLVLFLLRKKSRK